MPLLSFWASNPAAINQLNIEQIVSNAGDGMLLDQSVCSNELREYFGQIPTENIASFVEHCLSSSFARGGMVLQDLINELGRRLDYEVKNGRYQGVSNAVGYDGLWHSPENHALIAEVKTTDAYRISLDTLAAYRNKLLAQGEITTQSSILIVVGRQDTGELEAQIRGSRHAWDVRVISAEALIKLVLLKENAEAAETGLKMRSLLTPVEYTRLDRMVDVMFATATDLEDASLPTEPVNVGKAQTPGSPIRKAETERAAFQFTDAHQLQAKREEIIAALGKREHAALIRKTRALYGNAQQDIRVACSISKRYSGKSQNPYWYAYHPAWDDYLREAGRSFFVLGCMDLDEAFAIPRAEMTELLPHLHTTTKDGNSYWHIHIVQRSGGLEMLIPKRGDTMPLSKFAFRAG